MKNKKLYAILSFVVASLLIAIGIIILPEVSNIGNTLLNYVLSLFILIYVFLFLIRKTSKVSQTKLIFLIIEIVLDIVIALSLIINEIGNIINIRESFSVIGLVLMLHSVFNVMRGFIVSNKTEYPFAILVLDLLLIIFGSIMLVRPLLTNVQMLYLTSIISFVISIITIIFGILLLKKKKVKAIS